MGAVYGAGGERQTGIADEPSWNRTVSIFLKSMQQTKTNKMTSVNTTYARIVLILLAVNLLFTGYVVTRITSTSEAQQVTVPAKVETADETPLTTE